MVCRVFFSGTRQRASLPSAKEKTLGKNKTLGKEGSLPSVKKTLGKDLLCRVFFLHSAKTPFAECKKRNTRQRKFQIKI